MSKKLKGYICLTMLLSSFGTFADTCNEMAAELIEKIKSEAITHPQSLEEIDDAKIKYHNLNSPRCIGYFDEILTEITTTRNTRLTDLQNEIMDDKK
jgi:hypothetical protein